MERIIVIDIDTFKAYRATKSPKAIIKAAGLTKALLVMKSYESMQRQLTTSEVINVSFTNKLKVSLDSGDEAELARKVFAGLEEKRLPLFKESLC